MKILLADDDPLIRRITEGLLTRWHYEVVSVADGNAAWELLQREDAPHIAVLDWQMPGLDGVEVCRRARAQTGCKPLHILIVTVRTGTENVVEALRAGADDYLTKPFIAEELRARIQVGERIIKLQADLASRVHELETALGNVKRLEGLLPICTNCHRVRDDHRYWQDVESYVSEHSGIRFSHGICPACFETMTGKS